MLMDAVELKSLNLPPLNLQNISEDHKQKYFKLKQFGVEIRMIELLNMCWNRNFNINMMMMNSV